MLHFQKGEKVLGGNAGDLLPKKQLLRAGYDLRADVCKMMIEKKDEIAPFITGIFDAYVEAMALEGCWGGGTSLFLGQHGTKDCSQRMFKSRSL